jgi:DNA-binding transcriptional MerR regulator
MAPVRKSPADRFDDEHYPAYTTGRAAEMIGTTPACLRSMENAHLFDPMRSGGGHRRYSRHQLRLAARVRDIANHGTPVEAACRIVILQDQLTEALEHHQHQQRVLQSH